MANDSVHSEGIRLQAERVVRAYKELREAPKNADFKSDDFPVGLFADLVQQIKVLDGWLEPSDEPRLAELRAAVTALRDLPELLKPYTVTGTKLRLPSEISDPLGNVVSELRPILDNVHYEGVHYGYQDEPADPTVRKITAIADEAAEKMRRIADEPEITVLLGDQSDAIYGLHGVVEALVDLDDPASLELALAARELAKRLYSALGSLTPDVEHRIEAAGLKVHS
jgi:hypothetical protein